MDTAEVKLARLEAERTALQTENAELKTKLATSEDDKVALQFSLEAKEEIQAENLELRFKLNGTADVLLPSGTGTLPSGSGKGGGKGKVGRAS